MDYCQEMHRKRPPSPKSLSFHLLDDSKADFIYKDLLTQLEDAAKLCIIHQREKSSDSQSMEYYDHAKI